ncbi:MAG: hypothetical protein B6D56_05805 [Candidatus Omnitrophica bacterium 4484_70.1]|nr:MAG: hypothetical protein B6D56_05805 [Candidatus Omnitrophica bacterium 4484_70.1]
MEVFNQKVAKNYNQWYAINTRWDELEKRLILELIKPDYSKTLLDIGCGCGWHLKWFKDLGLKVWGVDKSPFMAEEANRFLGENVVEVMDAENLKFNDKSFNFVTLITVLEFTENPEKEVMDAENLKFNDKSFNFVTLITVLEFTENPEKVLREALRVAQEKVFLGVLNKYSWLGIKRKIESFFKKESLYKKAKFFSVREILKLLHNIIKNGKIEWGTTIPHTPEKNRWGAFIGVIIEK